MSLVVIVRIAQGKPLGSAGRRPATRLRARLECTDGQMKPQASRARQDSRGLSLRSLRSTRRVFVDANSLHGASKQPSPKSVFACSPQRVDDTLKLRFSRHAI